VRKPDEDLRVDALLTLMVSSRKEQHKASARRVTSDMTSPAPHRLSGSLGPGDIVFMVLAAAAPLAVVGGVVPVGALLGNGAGLPSMFLVGGALLFFFAVGLSTMSRYVPRAGAFFTYVGYGLGRPAGIAAAWLAFLTYTAAQIAVITYLGLTLGNYVENHVGLSLPWWFWALGLVMLVGFLGYRHVALSSKVLAIVMVCEIGLVLLLAVVILAQGGADGLNIESFRADVVMSGSPALALMFAMSGFFGFESTAIYRDEARDPERTIPRATYAAIALITLFYTFASWTLVQGWGQQFGAAIGQYTSKFLVVTAERYLGQIGAQIINVLLLASFFACTLSFHNVTARYQHAMSNARLLPRSIGKVHAEYKSPHLSSLTQTVTIFIVLAVFALLGMDPYLEIYTWLGGLTSVTVVMLMALTCLAVVVYLNRSNIAVGAWRAWIAPLIGLAGLVAVVLVLFKNLPLLLGDVDAAGAQQVGWLTLTFYLVISAFPAFGLAQAAWLRAARPTAYDQVIETISD
jgi:amino acid transporter